MHKEAVEAVEQINTLFCERAEYMPLSVSYEPLWGYGAGSGQERVIGTHTPSGLPCSACGGHGTDEPRESLFGYLVREMRRQARETLVALEGQP